MDNCQSMFGLILWLAVSLAFMWWGYRTRDPEAWGPGFSDLVLMIGLAGTIATILLIGARI